RARAPAPASRATPCPAPRPPRAAARSRPSLAHSTARVAPRPFAPPPPSLPPLGHPSPDSSPIPSGRPPSLAQTGVQGNRVRWNRHVRPGGPVRDLSDLVRVGAPAFLRDRPRQVPVLLPPEEVVHRERQRQQRGEVPAGLAFEQRRGEGRGSDLEANLQRAHHLL